MITIQRLSLADEHKLKEFELANRNFFASMVPDRGNDYFETVSFASRHASLLREQNKGHSYFYLIKNEEDEIIGRINLSDIDHSTLSGQIGYRVGERHTGKGVTYQALDQLKIEMRKKGIKRFCAKTTTENFPSQKVLEKCGFSLLSKDKETFLFNGRRVSFLYYIYDLEPTFRL